MVLRLLSILAVLAAALSEWDGVDLGRSRFVISWFAYRIAPGVALARWIARPGLLAAPAVAITLAIAIAPLAVAVVSVVPALVSGDPRWTSLAVLTATTCGVLWPRGGRPRIRWSSATAWTCAVGVAVGAVVLYLHRPDTAGWLSAHGLLHSAVAESILHHGLPVQHPFMAGAPFGYYWVYHLQMGLIARAGSSDLLTVMAVETATNAFAYVLVVALLVRRVGRLALDKPRLAVALAATLVLLSLNSLGPLLLKVGRAMNFDLPPLPGGWAPVIAGTDVRVGSTLDNLVASGSRLPAEVCGWLAVVFAAFSSRPPVLLSSLLGLTAFVLNPIVGGALLGTAGVVAVYRGGARRRETWTSFGGAAVLGLLYLFGTCISEEGGHLVRTGAPEWWNTFGPQLQSVLVAGLCLLLCAIGRASRSLAWSRSRTLQSIVWIPFALLTAASLFVKLPLSDQYLFVRLLSVPCAIAAAACLAASRNRRQPAQASLSIRVVGGFALLACLPAPLYVGVAAYRSARAPGLVQVGEPLSWAGDTSLDAVTTWLRNNTPPDSVVILDPRVRFTGVSPAQGNPLVALSGRRLFVDDGGNYLARPERIRRQREQLRATLLSGKPLASKQLEELAALPAPLYVVEPAARNAARLANAAPGSTVTTVLEKGPYAVRQLKIPAIR